MGALVKDLRNKAELEEVLQQKCSAALHFWASWCPASAQMDTVFSHLCSENPNTHFFRVEAEETPDISEAYNVSAVPFFVFIKLAALREVASRDKPGCAATKQLFTRASLLGSWVRSGVLVGVIVIWLPMDETNMLASCLIAKNGS